MSHETILEQAQLALERKDIIAFRRLCIILEADIRTASKLRVLRDSSEDYVGDLLTLTRLAKTPRVEQYRTALDAAIQARSRLNATLVAITASELL